MGHEPFRSGAGVVDRSDRTKLHFTGEQAFWFIDQLLTNKLDEMEAGTGAESLLLTPNGRTIAWFRVLASGSSAFADCDPGQGPMLTEFFRGRVFTTKVEIADRTGDFGIITILGPRADQVTTKVLSELASKETPEQRGLGLTMPGDDEHATTHFGASVAVRVLRPVRGVDLWVTRDRVDEVIDRLQAAGGEVVGVPSYNDLCVVEGLPRFGIDFDDKYLPQEAALERTVHFAKGCYLGQEAVAMTQRGRVKRRLRHLTFETDPATGPITFQGEPAGTATSAAAEDGAAFGIGAVSTSVPLGAIVEVSSGEEPRARAEVHELPGTLEGPSVPSARELRERLQGGTT
ncbi:MAG: YgfZ/GcvT domain-containing protein [Actinomycetota bacterium]